MGPDDLLGLFGRASGVYWNPKTRLSGTLKNKIRLSQNKPRRSHGWCNPESAAGALVGKQGHPPRSALLGPCGAPGTVRCSEGTVQSVRKRRRRGAAGGGGVGVAGDMGQGPLHPLPPPHKPYRPARHPPLVRGGTVQGGFERDAAGTPRNTPPPVSNGAPCTGIRNWIEIGGWGRGRMNSRTRGHGPVGGRAKLKSQREGKFAKKTTKMRREQAPCFQSPIRGTRGSL